MIYRFINEAISPTLIKSIQDNNFSNDVEWKEIYKKLVLDWDDVVANYADTIKALDKAVAEGKKPEDNRNLRTKIKDLALKKVGYDPKEIGTREQRKQEETLNKTLDVIRSVDPFNARIAYLTAVLRAFFEHVNKKSYKKYIEPNYNLFYRQVMVQQGFDPKKENFGNTFFELLTVISKNVLDTLSVEELKLIDDLIHKGLINKNTFSLQLDEKDIFNFKTVKDLLSRESRDIQYILHVINILTSPEDLEKYFKEIPEQSILRQAIFKSDGYLRQAGKDGDKFSPDDDSKNTMYAWIEHLSEGNEKEKEAAKEQTNEEDNLTLKEFMENNNINRTSDLQTFIQSNYSSKSKYSKEIIDKVINLLSSFIANENASKSSYIRSEENPEITKAYQELINSDKRMIPDTDKKYLQVDGIVDLINSYSNLT